MEKSNMDMIYTKDGRPLKVSGQDLFSRPAST